MVFCRPPAHMSLTRHSRRRCIDPNAHRVTQHTCYEHGTVPRCISPPPLCSASPRRQAQRESAKVVLNAPRYAIPHDALLSFGSLGYRTDFMDIFVVGEAAVLHQAVCNPAVPQARSEYDDMLNSDDAALGVARNIARTVVPASCARGAYAMPGTRTFRYTLHPPGPAARDTSARRPPHVTKPPYLPSADALADGATLCPRLRSARTCSYPPPVLLPRSSLHAFAPFATLRVQ